MKQILFPLVLLWSLWSTPLTSQNLQAPIILEGHIISEIQQSFDFDIDKAYTKSVLNATTIEVVMPKHLQGLIRSMRAFKNQRWRITVERKEQRYVLKSIFGLGLPDQQEPESSTPVPLAESFPEREFTPEHQHQRSTIASANQQAIVELTNEVRWDNGMRPPLKQVDLLHTAAQGHSEDMAFDHFFMHCNPDNNSTPGSRMSAAGYYLNSGGENIAAGNSSAEATINQWVNSPGHYSNMVSTSYREIGVGHAYDSSNSPGDRFDTTGNCVPDIVIGPYYNYWTQKFGRRNTVYPVVINREAAVTTSTSVSLYVYGVGNATSMRFSNDQVNWSAWESYQENKNWTLVPGNGMKTVYAQISTGSNGSGTVRSSSDMITLNGSCGLMTLSNMTINSNTTYTECEIVADPNVSIDAGEVIFEANTVTLGSNVEITPGTVFEVRLLSQ